MSKLTDSLLEGAHALLDKASDWQERIVVSSFFCKFGSWPLGSAGACAALR